LLGQQRLLLVALLLELVDVGLTDFQFLIRRHEQTDYDKPEREKKKSQEDTIPTPPNASFTPCPEICVIHFQRILPP